MAAQQLLELPKSIAYRGETHNRPPMNNTEGENGADMPPPHIVLFSAGQNYGRLNVLTRKIAIWARVTGLSGQYFSGVRLQPPVIPTAYNRSIQLAAQ